MKFSESVGVLARQKILLCLFVLMCISGVNSARNRNRTNPRKPIIEISDGQMKGESEKSRNGRQYFEFLGIPYAKPPIGNLRFESPQPAEPWGGILKATKFQSECIQMDVIVTGRSLGLEDCLYLNVFTTQLKPLTPMPVMIYLHGGLFHAGSSDRYRGKYFMDEDIVLVTLNYRLGAMGFLSTGDGKIRGNMGLRDQILALKWVQKNIKHFGGNPDSVTLFGESAGAACVQWLMLSPLARGLFHRGISQSGSATRKYLLTDDQRLQAKHFSEQIHCPTTSTEEMVKCLRKADAETIVQIHKEAVTPERNPFSIFGPIVEFLDDSEAVLAQEPIQVLKSGNYSKLPWMAGVNSGEGLMYTAQLLRDVPLLAKLEQDWRTIFPKLLRLYPDTGNNSPKVREYYFGQSPLLNIKQSIQNFTDMFSDRFFYQPTKLAAMLHARHAPAYLYYFDHKTKFTIYDLVISVTPNGLQSPQVEFANYMANRWLQQSLSKIPVPFYGACHGDELSMLFNVHHLAQIKPRSKHYKLSSGMIKLWTDFAKNNSSLAFEGIPFLQVDLKDSVPKYMELSTSPRLISEPFNERIRFWESLNIVDKYD